MDYKSIYIKLIFTSFEHEYLFVSDIYQNYRKLGVVFLRLPALMIGQIETLIWRIRIVIRAMAICLSLPLSLLTMNDGLGQDRREMGVGGVQR